MVILDLLEHLTAMDNSRYQSDGDPPNSEPGLGNGGSGCGYSRGAIVPGFWRCSARSG